MDHRWDTRSFRRCAWLTSWPPWIDEACRPLGASCSGTDRGYMRVQSKQERRHVRGRLGLALRCGTPLDGFSASLGLGTHRPLYTFDTLGRSCEGGSL